MSNDDKDDIPTTVEIPSSCRRCGSTRRTRREGVTRHKANIVIDGQIFNVVVWARCKCASCGARRIIKQYHFIEDSNETGT